MSKGGNSDYTMAAAHKNPVAVASEIRGLADLVKSLLPDVVVTDIPVNDDFSLNEESTQLLNKAQVLLCDPQITEQLIARSDLPLKWAHSTWAGAEKIVPKVQEKKTKPRFIFTRSGEGFGQIIGEYAVGHIIANERRFKTTYQNMEEKKWDLQLSDFRPLTSLTIGVLGLGQIGREIARMCKALGMCVWGLSRSQSQDCPYIDCVRGLSDLPEFLSKCDYVCSILPSTTETKGLLSGDVLSACRAKKSIFINVGRGDVIDEESLVNALKQEWIGGAILDVFTVEPLPVSSSLWNIPSVVITPHCSGPSLPQQVAEGFANNYKLFSEGKPLKYQVDWDKGY